MITDTASVIVKRVFFITVPGTPGIAPPYVCISHKLLNVSYTNIAFIHISFPRTGGTVLISSWKSLTSLHPFLGMHGARWWSSMVVAGWRLHVSSRLNFLPLSWHVCSFSSLHSWVTCNRLKPASFLIRLIFNFNIFFLYKRVSQAYLQYPPYHCFYFLYLSSILTSSLVNNTKVPCINLQDEVKDTRNLAGKPAGQYEYRGIPMPTSLRGNIFQNSINVFALN